jgi:hypothetical protein
MKSITTKKIVSLAAIALAAPVFAVAIVVSARSAGVAGNDLLLLALAFGGAAVSGLNGFGRRTAPARIRAGRRPRVARESYFFHESPSLTVPDLQPRA